MRRVGSPWERQHRSEGGAVAILIALLTVVLVGMLAFVTDLGMAYVNQQQLQNGADSAALAVSQQIALTANGNQTCDSIKNTMTTTMRSVAESYFAANAAGRQIETGAAGFEISCEPTGLFVRVTAAQDSPMFFGGVFGLNKIPIVQGAKTVVGPAKSVTGLRPFAVCRADANRLAAAPGTNYTISYDNSDSGCGSASGNWGVIDFNGGANGTPEVKGWIENGYSGSISLSPPILLPGNPGNLNGLAGSMESILGKEIVLPVFGLVTGRGNNSEFGISGFVSVEMCAWKFNNSSGAAGCASAVSPPVPADYIQVRYKRFIAMGDVSTSCALGNTTCDNGVRLFQLAE